MLFMMDQMSSTGAVRVSGLQEHNFVSLSPPHLNEYSSRNRASPREDVMPMHSPQHVLVLAPLILTDSHWR